MNPDDVTSHSVGPARALETPCVAHGPALWFAERAAELEQAKSLCGLCFLRKDCLAGAIQRGEPWGVWGGEILRDGLVVAEKRGRGRPPRPSVARSDGPGEPRRSDGSKRRSG